MSEANRPPSPDDHLDWSAAWHGLLASQQRWWNEWAEAGHLWTSWWLSQLPAATLPPGQWPLPPDPPRSHAAPAAASDLQADHTAPRPPQTVAPQRVRATARHR